MSRRVRGRTISNEPWYQSWRGMMDRCYRKTASNYKNYGGRGIKVCDDWHDIETFEIWAGQNGYFRGATLDRIDPNGDYEPSNCRWATRRQQANNRRNTIYVTIDGVTKTLSEWADFSGVTFSTIANRYHDGVRGVMLLRHAEDTKFKKGYKSRKHYENAPTIIEAEPDCTTCPVKGKACKVFYRDKGDDSVCKELREAEGEDG